MNTYDFDQTIFNPDSSYAFYIYCMKKYPGAVLPTVPKSLVTAIAYSRKRLTAKALKEQLFSFLSASTAAALGLILTCCSLGPCHPTLIPSPCAFRCTVALRGGVNDGSSPSPKRVTESHTESISPGKSHSEGPRLSWALLPSLAFLLRLLPATARHQAQLTSLACSL